MIADQIKNSIVRVLEDIGQELGADLKSYLIARPKKEGFGDFSSAIAMALKNEGQNPKEMAEKLVDILQKDESLKKHIKKIVIDGPGFINFYLSNEFLQNQVKEILEAGDSYGQNNLGQNKKVQVEFISANPTGPLTLGNGRGGVFGDVLGNVLKGSGYDVTKEYYINDAGGQIEILGHSILKDEKAEYKGDYIDELEKKILRSAQNDKEKNALKVGQQAQAVILDQIKKTVAAMGINFNQWFSETKELRDTGKVEENLKRMKEAGITYEKDGAVWFKAAEFGDEKDRVLIKSDGQPTYFGVDCAYHYNKFEERGFDRVFNIWGADHHGDVARVKGFAQFLGMGDKLEFILMQFVRLVQNGQEVRMSKRKGTYVTVDEVLEAVGRDAFRFFMLMYSPTTHMDFDLDLAKEQSQKNPVYYVQYGYARIASIMSKLKNSAYAEASADKQNLELLTKVEELDLIRQLIKYPEIVADTAQDYQIHRVPQYAKELVAAFHKFYERCRVLDDDQNIQTARLQLVSATKIVLKNILDLMGITAPEKM